MRKLVSGLVLLNIGLLIGLFVRDAIAARNSAGNMAAVNGPYVAGTTISSSAINARFADIESEITASLSRDAKGGMRSALRGIDGTVAAPAFSWTSETGSGLYRIGASDLGVAVGGAKQLELTSALFTVSGSLGIGASAAYPLDVSSISGNTNARFGTMLFALGTQPTIGFNLSHDGANFKYATSTKGGAFAFDTTNGFIFDTAPSGTAGNTATITERMRVNDTGVTIGAGGTAISGSFANSAAWTPGSIGAGVTLVTTITVTGAAAGAPCFVGPPPSPTIAPTCAVTLNTCSISLFNPTAAPITGTAGTYSCRVVNP